VEHDNTPPDKYSVQFAKQKGVVSRQIVAAETSLATSQVRAVRNAERFRERFGKDPEPGQFDGTAIATKHYIGILTAKEALMRPSSDADVAYREHVHRDLGPAIAESTPPELPLRFHGNTIIDAKGVLGSQELSSSVDRLGVETSMDGQGAFSVTTAQGVGVSIDGYMGMFDDKCTMPPGCLFAVLPESALDADAGHRFIMNNVDFGVDPSRLFGVAVAAESVDVMRQWAADAGVDPGKVQEYFEFTERLAALKARIDAGEVDVQSLVSYPLDGTQ
jgi:hypothetical protein